MIVEVRVYRRAMTIEDVSLVVGITICGDNLPCVTSIKIDGVEIKHLMRDGVFKQILDNLEREEDDTLQ